MLKILFCFNCCGAPPSSRPARGKAAAERSSEKLVEEANFKSLLTLNEKDQLLANQIHANNDNYGVKDSNNPQSGNILLLDPSQLEPDSTTAENPLKRQQQQQQQRIPLEQLRSEDDSLEASTSAPRKTFISNLGSVAASGKQREAAEQNAAYRAGESLTLSYDDASVSPPSSIDIDSFRENPHTSTEQPSSPRLTATATATVAGESKDDQQRTTTKTTTTTTTEVSSLNEAATSSTTVSSTAIQQKIITSTTKIGDYARLEYSPVEDLESVTTYSQSRGGSEKGGRWVSGPNSAATSRPSSFRNTSGNVSRRSSQGIESTSISIASQLSNEQQFQQNLTNMLESANSPIPLYGTIGLPLGPPLESMTATETAKTSPETTGAALTSASQDSLSGQSLDGAQQQQQQMPATMASTAGAALDSIEDSAELAEMTQDPMGGDKTRARLAQAEPDIAESIRIDSSLSMATTTSGGLTNPTPTPSEMSGTEKKKKSKLRAGKLFKRLKRGGSKKKSKEGVDTDKPE